MISLFSDNHIYRSTKNSNIAGPYIRFMYESLTYMGKWI